MIKYIERKEPVVAVIGDSFIEAIQAKNNESITGLILENLADNGHVNSFRLSGAPLFKYLKFK